MFSHMFEPKQFEQFRLRTILQRGCQIATDLDKMANNGTSFEDLIALHRRVHDFNDSLWLRVRKLIHFIKV